VTVFCVHSHNSASNNTLR